MRYSRWRPVDKLAEWDPQNIHDTRSSILGRHTENHTQLQVVDKRQACNPQPTTRKQQPANSNPQPAISSTSDTATYFWKATYMPMMKMEGGRMIRDGEGGRNHGEYIEIPAMLLTRRRHSGGKSCVVLYFGREFIG